MSVIEEAIKSLLVNDAGVNAIIGGRVHPQKLPQQPVLPAISFQRITTDRVRSHDGPSGLAAPTFQFNCWASDTESKSGYQQAKDLVNALRLLIDGFRGVSQGVNIRAVFVEDDRDDQDEDRVFERIMLDAVIWHEEAV